MRRTLALLSLLACSAPVEPVPPVSETETPPMTAAQYILAAAVLPVTWTATGGTITSDGLYTAPAMAGQYAVVAAVSGVADTAPVTVRACEAASLTLNTHSISLTGAGDTENLTATITTTCDDTTATPVVVWASSATTVATVASTGDQTATVTSVAPGTAYIKAFAGTLKDSALATVTAATPTPGAPGADSAWVGMNGNTGFLTSASYVAAVSAGLDSINAQIVRTGADFVGGANTTQAFTFTTRDAVVNAHVAAGDIMHMVMSPIDQVNRGSSQAQWEANWARFASTIMRRYQGKVFYYIVDNEPDIAFKNVTPAQMVALTKIAYDSAAVIDANIKIESPPTTSPSSSFLRDMINLGVTRYAHVLGLHSYGDQISDGHGQSIKTPWAWMLASGYPVLPVASSENGVDANYGGRDWQARWVRQNYVQHKAFGYDHVILYSFNSFSGEHWDFATWNGSSLVPREPGYSAIPAAYKRRPFANGGFEDANDREIEWVIYWETAQTGTPAEWGRAEFVTGDGANARSGTGYLRFDTGESSGSNRVRRVVELLTPGTPYTVTAWVKIAGGGTATLKAMGYNHLNGTQQQSASTTTTGSYQQLQVTFTPSKTWVVISLEGTGTSGGGSHVMRWDDVSMSP
jgi:hypothetical protein